MNAAFLDSLPEVRSDLGPALAAGEKVVFAARLACFGTETDAFLGGHTSKLYLTNRRLIANNTVGLWTVELATDIASCAIVENGIPLLKSTVVRVDLNKEVVYGDGQGVLRGLRFYLAKRDGDRFAALMDSALR